MERQHYAAVSLVLLIAVALAGAAVHGSPGNATASFISDGEKLATVTLEVADEEPERREGLMNRRSLRSDHGMLFVFPDERVRSFWMKNTYIPLDMIFIAENGTIVEVQQADPEPNTPDEELKGYVSSSPAKYVIEVNQGFSVRNGIESGDYVNLTTS